MSIRALIFDFDGLILDTESSEFQAWQELYAEYGCTLTLDIWADCVGRPHGFFDPYLHLQHLSGQPIHKETLKPRRRERCRQLNEAKPPQPGILDYLTAAKSLDLQLAVVSSSTFDWVNGHLQRLGLRGYFDLLICAEDTLAHKPDPTPYLHALQRLDRHADQAIAFEDSPNGVTAAIAAGLFTVAVPNPITAALPLAHASLQLPALSAMPLPDLLAHAHHHHPATTRTPSP